LSAEISIIIPVYNGSDFLRDAIDSAIAQTYSQSEIIVVNDGSTDDGATEEIAKSYGTRIRYFAKENGHVASALNYGISKMEGEYFSWLSHDDMYYPDKIALQVRALELLGDQTVVYSDYETLDVDTGVRIEHRLPATKPEQFRWSITVASRIHGCTLLIPRVCFNKCGVFDTTLRTTQDYDMWFRIAEYFQFVHVPGVVVAARIHSGQGTRQLSDIVVRECDTLLAGFVSSLKESELAASSRKLPGGSYGVLAENMQSRGLVKARNTALALGHTRLKDESLSKPIVMRMAVARLSIILSARRLRRLTTRGIRFLLRKVRGNQLGLVVQKRFTAIYRHNVFGSEESRSGMGSSLVQTETIRRELPGLLQSLEVRTMLDAPCGDFNWMQHTSLPVSLYIGADVVDELIAEDIRRYSNAARKFVRMDVIRDRLPASDLVFCRDCLVHLNFDQARGVLRNFQASGAKYLLTTTFPGTQTNVDLGPKDIWRTLNLERPPFNLPPPVRLINENCTEDDGAYADKSLGLWLLRDLKFD